MTDQHTSLHDKEEARRAAQSRKRAKDRDKPVLDVACACGCGVWPERLMYYYVIADIYIRSQTCADKVFRKDIGYTRQMLNLWLRGGG